MSDTTANVVTGIFLLAALALMIWGVWAGFQAAQPILTDWYNALTFEDVKFMALFALVWAVLK